MTLLKPHTGLRGWVSAAVKYLLSFLISFSFFLSTIAQNSLNSGDGWGSGWGTGAAFSSSAGTSLIYTTNNSSGGPANRFFRFFGNGTPCGHYGPTGGANQQINIGTEYSSLSCYGDNNGSYFINVANNSNNYVFKSQSVSAANIIVFEVAGTIRSISTVSQSPTTVFPGQDVTITANLSGTFATGQAAFLRYSTDNFATSNILKMTGSGTSYSAIIPASDNSPSSTIRYYVFTSGDITSIASSKADWYTINLNNNSGSNYSYVVQSGWVTANNGNWSSQTSWTANAVPPTNILLGSVTINHNITVDQNASISSLTISPTVTLTGSSITPRTISISSGGTFTNNGTYTAGNETISFAGAGTINGSATTFNNVTINNGAVNLTTIPTINGTLLINNVGGTVSASPNYGSSSSLVYAVDYLRFNEWNPAGVSSGLPFNVTVNNGATLNLSQNNGNLTCRGKLTINGTVSWPTSNPSAHSLTVNGDVEIAATGTLTASSNASAVITVGGSWNRLAGGTFTPGTASTVVFTGTSQSITASGGATFNNLTINGSLSAASSIIVNNTLNIGNGNSLALNGNNLTTVSIVSGGTGASISNGNGSVASILTVNNTAANTFSGTIVNGSSAALSLVKGGGGVFTLSNNNSFTGGVTINAGTLQVANSGALNSTTPNAISFGAASTGTLQLNGNSITVASVNTNATPGTTFIENGAAGNATLTINGTSTFAGVFRNGSTGTLGITISSGTLTLSGANTYGGITTIPSGATLTFNASNASSANSNVILNGGTLSFGSGVPASSTFTAGTLTLSSSSIIDVGSSSGSFTITFANSNAITWTGTLTINNWTVAANKNINFASGGLTPSQLDPTISFTGFGVGSKFVTNTVYPKFYYVTQNTGSGSFLNDASWINGRPTSNDGTEFVLVQAGFTLNMDQNFQSAGVDVAGTINTGSNIITGSSFTLYSGATLGIGSALGITSSGLTGNIQTTLRTFNAGAFYVYNGTTNQVTGNGLPATITGQLVINNPGNTVSLSNGITLSRTVNNASYYILQLLNGNLSLNGNTLTLNGTVANSTNIALDGGTQRRITGTGTITVSGTPATGTPNLNVAALTGGSSLLLDVNTTLEASVGVNFGASGITLIDGVFRINSNGFVINNSPDYGNNSTLVYNNGSGGFNRNLEWSSTSGAGYPHDIIIQGNTPVTIHSVPFPSPAIACSGSLTIQTGSSLITGAALNNITIGTFCTVNGTLDASAMGNVSTFPDLIINGDLTIGGTLTLSNSTGCDLYLSGNWNRTGTFNANTRAVYLTGGNSTISATGGQSFPFLRIQKTSTTNTVTLNTPVTILNSSLEGAIEMSFTSGVIISTASNRLIMNDGTTYDIVQFASFVDGPVEKIGHTGTTGSSAFSFPVGRLVGSTLYYRPIEIGAGGSSTASYTARFFRASAYNRGAISSTISSVIQRVSFCEHWSLTRTGANVPVTLTWGNNSQCNTGTYVTDITKLWVVQYNGTQWGDSYGRNSDNGIATPGANQLGRITWNWPTAFQYFTLGSSDVNANPLPFTLLSFNGRNRTKDIELNFSVNGNDEQQHYLVERSADGRNFSTLIKLAATANRNSADYTTLDEQPVNGWNYYRVTAVDYNNRSTKSQIIRVWFGSRAGNPSIYPNPVQGGNVQLFTGGMPKGMYNVQIMGVDGKIILSRNWQFDGVQPLYNLSVPQLPAGMYYLLLRGENQPPVQLKFVK
jgi:autotransporter-associated beta strand protein